MDNTYLNNIGKKCAKTAFKIKNKILQPKPFKSGFKINTIKGVIEHPMLKNEMAYTFHEDDSYVECRRCEIIK